MEFFFGGEGVKMWVYSSPRAGDFPEKGNFLKPNKLVGDGTALDDNTKSITELMLPQYKNYHANSLRLRAVFLLFFGE